jgi:UDP-glucose 4-epimerase
VTVLITGGLGVNGSAVTQRLIERGETPVVLESNPDLSLIDPACVPRMELVTADITDSGNLREVMLRYRPERIVHCAAIVKDSDPALMFRVNAAASVELMRLALELRVKRFVFFSSRSVYGALEGMHQHPTYVAVDETHPLNGTSVYDAGKIASELMGQNFRRAGLDFVALRFSTIFGPGKISRTGGLPSDVVSRMIENAMAGVPSTLTRGGDQGDDILYVEDLVNATMCALYNEKVNYSSYNISTGRIVFLDQVYNILKGIFPDYRFSSGKGLNYFGTDINMQGALDNGRARRDLGFSPAFDLKSGIADYIRRMGALNLCPTNVSHDLLS